MFTEALQMVTAQPLLVRRVGNIMLKRGGNLCWAEYGEIDDRKVKHTVLYFHGAPGCRYEPVMHSSSSYDRRSFRLTEKKPLEYDKSHHLETHAGEGVDEGLGGELDVYSQRGIRLICIERPGFGDSSFVEDRTVADYVDDVIELTHSTELGMIKNSADDEKEGESASVRVGKKKAKNIYVIGYSAGGPYALAMRSLFEKKQILYNRKRRLASLSDLDRKGSAVVKSNIGVEEEVKDEIRDDKMMVEEEAEEKEDYDIIEIAAVCVVASSVSAAENAQYRQSFEGMALNLFFSLPMSVQNSFYSVSFGALLYGVRGSVYVLSLLGNNQTATTVIKNDNDEVNLIKDKNLKNALKEKNEYENENRNENENENEKSQISKIASKLSAIDQIITKSLFKYNGKAMTTDTLATQWGGRPWGFKMTPNPSEKVPPILFFYSKEDCTVPPHTGITLCNECLGEGNEPIWLSGGHSCFILHLKTILDRLLACSENDEK